MQKHVYFVRHGKSIANATGRIGEPGTPLAEEGLEQARITGQDLKAMNVSTILCSPLIRAQQTAEIIAGEVGVPVNRIKIIEGLHERRMGELEGKPKQYESSFFIRNDAELGFETHAELIARCELALDKIRQALAQSDGSVVVVGHAVSGLFLQQVARGHQRVDDFDTHVHISNAEYIELPIA
jgi:probable phosphoglycerate mutase